MKKIIISILVVFALHNPMNARVAETISINLSYQIKDSGIDPDDQSGKGRPFHKCPVSIPIIASHDTHYIYVSSKTAVSGTYKITDASEAKVSEGIVSTSSTIEQKINIGSLQDGEYKFQLIVGDQTYEGSFCIE